MSRAALLTVAALMSSPAFAQQATVTLTAPPGSLQGAPVKKLLADGYEIKAGFADNTGGAYMVLQKTTSAYLCHSNPTPTCEKLN